jgi:hypothetical protein
MITPTKEAPGADETANAVRDSGRPNNVLHATREIRAREQWRYVS